MHGLRSLDRSGGDDRGRIDGRLGIQFAIAFPKARHQERLF